jgi:SAM-dependent methyltransferase
MRRNYVPWRAAGTTTELKRSADEVVRDTGWVFNNKTGSHLSLAEFVETGNHETLAYLTAFGLGDDLAGQTLVEIGAGIGRMTASFTRLFGRVIACDLDGAFLERCRETVAQFGRPERLQTSRVADGRTIALPDGTGDLAFSYITLQHCHRDDALALTAEALRVTRAGGHVALNYRTWTAGDVVLWPAGHVVRGLWRVPKFGPALPDRCDGQGRRAPRRCTDREIAQTPQLRHHRHRRPSLRRRAPQPLVAGSQNPLIPRR